MGVDIAIFFIPVPNSLIRAKNRFVKNGTVNFGRNIPTEITFKWITSRRDPQYSGQKNPKRIFHLHSDRNFQNLWHNGKHPGAFQLVIKNCKMCQSPFGAAQQFIKKKKKLGAWFLTPHDQLHKLPSGNIEFLFLSKLLKCLYNVWPGAHMAPCVTYCFSLNLKYICC